MTTASIVRTLVMAGLGVVVLAAPAAAQERPGPAVELAAGWVGFVDDTFVNEALVGAAARVYLLPRISVGPELVHIQGQNHSHLMLTGNVTWDVLTPVNGRPRRVTPFVVAGGGIFQTRETFSRGPFTSREGAFTAGGGVRAFITDRVTVGVDARVGLLHLGINALVGFQLGH